MSPSAGDESSTAMIETVVDSKGEKGNEIVTLMCEKENEVAMEVIDTKSPTRTIALMQR